MRTAIVKCSVPHCSENAFCLVDSKGKEAYIPFQFKISEKRDANGCVYEVTIPLWLAIDRKVQYRVSK